MCKSLFWNGSVASLPVPRPRLGASFELRSLRDFWLLLPSTWNGLGASRKVAAAILSLAICSYAVGAETSKPRVVDNSGKDFDQELLAALLPSVGSLDSAEFRELRRGRSASVICGEVSALSGDGSKGPFVPFYVDMVSNRALLMPDSASDNFIEALELYASVC